jgi:hypothetical protein
MGRRMSVARKNRRKDHAEEARMTSKDLAALELYRRTPQTLAAAKAKYNALKEDVPRGVPRIQSLIDKIQQSIDRLFEKMASRMVCLKRVGRMDANEKCCEMHSRWHTHERISTEIVQVLNDINNMTSLLLECRKTMTDAEQKLHIAVEKHNFVFNELASIFEDDDGSELMTISIDLFSLTSPIPTPYDRLKGTIQIHDLPSRMSAYHDQCFDNNVYLRLEAQFEQLESKQL